MILLHRPGSLRSMYLNVRNPGSDSSTGQRICMNCDPLDLNFLLRSILLIYLNSLHLRQSRQTIISKHMSKHSILAIEMWRLVETDEKLASICCRPFICHTDNPSRVMAKCWSDLVFERLFPYR